MSVGCTTHTVMAVDRGGAVPIGVLENPSLVRWTRYRDEISNAVVRLTSPGPRCAALLADLRSGRHEIVVYRDKDRVWEGPITRIGYHPQYVEIEARDVMHYVYRTIARQAYNNAYPNVAYVTERAKTMLLNEVARKEAQDPPINVLPWLDVRTNAETARTSRSIKAYQMTVWEDIDTMAARSGLDYTVIGRRIVINDVHDVIGRTPILTEDDFLEDIVATEYGMELSTYSAVTDGEGRWGAVNSSDPYYGEWELLATNYEEETASSDTGDPTPPTTEELKSQAQRNAAGRFPAPFVIRVPDGSLINPSSTALSITELVPGVRVPVRAKMLVRTVQQEQKLDVLRVEETSRGETVAVTLSPAPGVLPDSWAPEGSDL